MVVMIYAPNRYRNTNAEREQTELPEAEPAW